MANHVSTHIHFTMNEAAQAKLVELGTKANEGYQYNDGPFSAMLTDQEVNNIGDAIDLMGAKWCYLEHCDENSLSLVSAWSYPQDGISRLVDILLPLDPDLQMNVYYDDECPNFFGAQKWVGDDIVNEEEWDWDELIAYMIETHEELKEGQDENGEWKTEEQTDFFHEHMYDAISDLQSEVFVEEED